MTQPEIIIATLKMAQDNRLTIDDLIQSAEIAATVQGWKDAVAAWVEVNK